MGRRSLLFQYEDDVQMGYLPEACKTVGTAPAGPPLLRWLHRREDYWVSYQLAPLRPESSGSPSAIPRE